MNCCQVSSNTELPVRYGNSNVRKFGGSRKLGGVYASGEVCHNTISTILKCRLSQVEDGKGVCTHRFSLTSGKSWCCH